MCCVAWDETELVTASYDDRMILVRTLYHCTELLTTCVWYPYHHVYRMQGHGFTSYGAFIDRAL